MPPSKLNAKCHTTSKSPLHGMYPDISKLLAESSGGRGGSSDAV